MIITQHLWELLIFLVILGAPVPLCLVLQQAEYTFETSEAKAAKNNASANSFSDFTAQRFDLSYALLFALTVWSVLQVSLGLLLGSLHLLRLGPLIASELGLFAIGLALQKRSRSQQITNQQIRVQRSEVAPFRRAEVLLLAAMAIMGAILLQRVATEPMTNYDSLWFHLPAVARWYQTGSLTLLDAAGQFIFNHPTAHQYPYNWHILSVFCVIPFKEDFLVALPMLLAWVMLALGVYWLCRQIGAARFYSLAATTLALSVPMLLDQVTTLHIDLPLATFFTLGLCLALSYHQRRSPYALSLFLAVIGLLSGIKTPGIVYAAFLIAILVLLECQLFCDSRANLANTESKKREMNRLNWKHPAVGSGVIALLWLGGFWYVRNALGADFSGATSGSFLPELTHSQLANSQTQSASLWSKLASLQASTLTYSFDLTNFSHWKTYGIQALVRLQLPFMVLLAQVLLLPFAWIKASKTNRQRLSFWALLLLGTGFLYWNTPYSAADSHSGQLSALLGFNLRYGFPVLGVMGAIAAKNATILKLSKRWLFAVCIVSSFSGILSSVVFTLIRNQSFTGRKVIWAGQIINTFKDAPLVAAAQTWQLLRSSLAGIGFYAAVCIGLMALAYRLSDRPLRSRSLKNALNRRLAVAVCIALLIASSWITRQTRDLYRARIYQGIYSYIEENTQPNEKIAYFSSDRNYLFYGKFLDRQVLHIPFDPEQPKDWLRHLRESKAPLVATGPMRPGKISEAIAQLNQPQEVLTSSFGQDPSQEPVLYRIN